MIMEGYKKCSECGHVTEEIVDSCCGYYGTDSFEQMKQEAGVDKTWRKIDV